MHSSVSPFMLVGLLVAYFCILIAISWWSSARTSNAAFFVGNRESSWIMVAIGMVGATLSGITFISVPGYVGSSSMSYMQMVMGYVPGYLFIAFVLMPLYYKLRLTSIYSYLGSRFGPKAHKVGATFFLISRTIGASMRLFLVVIVVQKFVLDPFGVPYWLTIVIILLLIWVYTQRSGIKTIIYTDVIQTSVMIVVLFWAIYELVQASGMSLIESWSVVSQSDYSKIFFFDNGFSDPNNFFKSFLAGMFMTIVMTGLDQDMMQKNLSCRTLGDAQKNMITFSGVLVLVNLAFLFLGVLLFLHKDQVGFDMPTKMVGGEARSAPDLLFPTVAFSGLSASLGYLFFLGLLAAAYSSADSALTSLTTSFCIDILEMDESETDKNKRTRRMVHIGATAALFVVILVFYQINDESVVSALFKAAAYTYGPLLGLFFFGMFTKLRTKDAWIPIICLLSPFATYGIQIISSELGYVFGFELLLVNGLITFLGLAMTKTNNNVRNNES